MRRSSTDFVGEKPSFPRVNRLGSATEESESESDGDSGDGGDQPHYACSNTFLLSIVAICVIQLSLEGKRGGNVQVHSRKSEPS